MMKFQKKGSETPETQTGATTNFYVCDIEKIARMQEEIDSLKHAIYDIYLETTNYCAIPYVGSRYLDVLPIKEIKEFVSLVRNKQPQLFAEWVEKRKICETLKKTGFVS